MHLQPGALVRTCTSPDATYQVVNVDDLSDCVWLHQVRPISSELS
jgi:hypothetical protein